MSGLSLTESPMPPEPALLNSRQRDVRLAAPNLSDLPDDDAVRRLQPYLRLDLADAIEAWMIGRYAMRRPPAVAARVLAMICDLHAAQAPFPQRTHVAHVAGCTIFGVDVALNTALTRGDITLESRLAPGFIAARESVRRHRHYVPCHELLSLAQVPRRAG